MTSSAAFDAPPASAPPAAAPAGPPPVITANRRRLDNRFPVLAFSVRTQGKPWFEVLLTTDRSLFDPANAARRTASNFYAGRQDGGLSRAAGEETAYVVPAAVLRRFAVAQPRPSEIFFTAAAYVTPDGPPLLAHPVAVLAATAPSVALSRDFEARTMAVVLGVPAEKLQPVDAVAATAPPSPEELDAAGSAAAEAWDADPVALALDEASAADHDAFADELDAGLDDVHVTHAAEADDAYAADAYDADAYAYDADADAFDADTYHESFDEGFAAPYESTANGRHDVAYEGQLDDPADGHDVAAEALTHDGSSDAHADGFDYDDGFGADALAEAAASSWPAGAPEPEPLEDADEEAAMEAAMAADLEPYGELGLEGDAALDGERGLSDAEPVAYEQAYAAEPEADEGSAFGFDDLEPQHDSTAQAAADVAPPAMDVATALDAPLDIPAKIAIVTKLGRLFEAGAAYAGVNRDGEFSNPRLPQYQKWHVGLSYGFIQFTQDSGGLGQLLRMMRERDAAAFNRIFGPHADALIEVTNRPGPSGRGQPGGRSARVQPVAGADLWDEPWVSRFREAGAHPPFQAAQNELAVRRHLDPLLPLAAAFGLTSERALAMVVDRGIQMGVAGARSWLTRALNPIRTDAQRQQALGALGFADVASFQRANQLHADGEFGPLTQIAMVAALRRLGPASPIAMPTRDQLMDAIVTRAREDHARDPRRYFWAHRPARVRTSTEFTDTVLTWPAGA